MGFGLKNFWKGLRLVPNSTNTTTQKGDLQVTTSDSRLNFHNGTSSSPIVTQISTDILTNKSLVDNSTQIVGVNDHTKVLTFNTGLATTGTFTNIEAEQTANRSIILPDANTTLVGTDTTDTLTNKTLINPTITGGSLTPSSLVLLDNTFVLENNSDNTKHLKFNASAITTGTTRTLTAPDADTTILGNNTNQLITNKTLDFTNLLILADDNFAINQVADATSGFRFNASNIPTSTQITLLTPSASTTLVGTNSTQTLTNKTISTANNTIQSGAALNGQVLTADGASGTSWQNNTDLFLSGMIMPYGGGSLPVGWIVCDGSAISRITYASLFAVLNITWGPGDGSTTFNVPDLRGRTLIGAGTGPGLSPRNLGDTTGEETHQLAIGESGLLDHTHGVSDPGHAHSVHMSNSTGNGNNPAQGNSDINGNNTTTTNGTGISIATSGAFDAPFPHQNMQPSAVVNYMIKT